MADQRTGNAAPSGRQRLHTGAAYDAAVDAVIAAARNEVRIFDSGLSPAYNSVKRYELLRAFLLAAPTNRLHLAVHDASLAVGHCPRLVLLSRQFSDRLSIHETLAEAKHLYDPFIIADENHYAHRFHYDSMRGELAFDQVADARALVKRFAEIWQASAPTAAATALGL